jgi:hypothetical protein
LEEIAPFFSKDEKACKELLETNIYYSIFPWQAGHQRRINVSVYGLDAAFPGQIQPALLRLYRRISRIWHHWLGILKAEEELAWIKMKKGGLSTNGDEQEEEERSSAPARKRRKVTDSETQTTPKKELSLLDIGVEDSPLTKELIKKARESEAMLRKANEAIRIRRRSRNLINELRVSI